MHTLALHDPLPIYADDGVVPQGSQQPGHDPGGPRERLRVSSTSMAHPCPELGLFARLGQWISASATWPVADFPRLVCSRRSECQPKTKSRVTADILIRRMSFSRLKADPGHPRLAWPNGYSPTSSGLPSAAGTTAGSAPPGRFSEIQPSMSCHQSYSHFTWASWVAVRGTASCGTRHHRALTTWAIGKFRHTSPTLTILSSPACATKITSASGQASMA